MMTHFFGVRGGGEAECPELLISEVEPRGQPGAAVAGCAAHGDDMSRLFMAAVATLVALGLSSDITIATDTPAQTAPGEGQAM